MRKFVLLLPFLCSSLAGCGNIEEEKVVYASFYPVYEFAKRIVGDKFEVRCLAPFHFEPHDYELTIKDAERMERSKAIFINGLGMEYWASDLIESLKGKTYSLSEGIQTLQISGVEDPHIWLNPENAILEMGNIARTMAAIDKENEAYYLDNLASQREIFLELHEELKEERKGFGNRYFAVSHAAFGYLADAYDLTQIYVSGLSPEEEPSAKSMEQISSSVRQYGLSTIFTEELASNEIAEAIARETGAKLGVLNPLEGLGEEEEADDYIRIMRRNFAKLKEASND